MKNFFFSLVLSFSFPGLYAQDVAVSDAVSVETVIPPNIVYTPNIHNLPKEAIEFCIAFSKRTNYINTIQRLGKKDFPKITKIFKKYHIPPELNVLIAIESFFNKNCVSKSGAVGYWQFMDQTAIEYGLSIDSAKDERKDFTKSTQAAARYLKNHYAILKDWYLTAAAYNCGLGNVKKAMSKSGKTNPGFFDIRPYLPQETQNYVMKYIALNLMLKNYSLFSSNNLRWYSVIKTETTDTKTSLSAAPATGLQQK